MTEQILAVQTMQDYIEAHLTDEITLADLAKACRFSPWYAHRMFREHTGYAPADYIRRLRLAKSALRLKSNHSKIIDVAYDLGFASVDGYTSDGTLGHLAGRRGKPGAAGNCGGQLCGI